MSQKLLEKIIKTKRELDKIPVIANLDFGHTSPIITFPIGGKAKINTLNGKPEIIILEH